MLLNVTFISSLTLAEIQNFNENVTEEKLIVMKPLKLITIFTKDIIFHLYEIFHE